MEKMRRMLLLGCLLAFGVMLKAQVGGGLFISGIASQIDGDQYGGYNKLGYHLGGYAFFAFNEVFEIEPEILIGQRGARQATETFIYHRRLNYIDVPVLVNARLDVGGGSKIMFQLGPYAGILFAANSGIKDFKLDVSHQYKKLDLGGIAGFTFEVQEKVGITMRSGLSFNNIFIDRFPYTQNRYIELGLRYSWR